MDDTLKPCGLVMRVDCPYPTDKIICTCCMGAGAHERYDQYHDRWTQEECQSCEGKGYITKERSDELWKVSGIDINGKLPIREG